MQVGVGKRAREDEFLETQLSPVFKRVKAPAALHLDPYVAFTKPTDLMAELMTGPLDHTGADLL